MLVVPGKEPSFPLLENANSFPHFLCEGIFVKTDNKQFGDL